MKPVWIAKAIGGTIGLIVFLAVVPDIVRTTIGDASQGMNRNSIQRLKKDINEVCTGEREAISGTIDLNSDTEVELTKKKMNVESSSLNKEQSYTLKCSIEEEQIIEGTQPYEVVKADKGGYKLA